MTSNDKLFHNLLSLQGKKIEVGILSGKKRYQGTLVNTMFDSFLLDCNGEHTVIRFNDLSFVNELSKSTAK